MKTDIELFKIISDVSKTAAEKTDTIHKIISDNGLKNFITGSVIVAMLVIIVMLSFPNPLKKKLDNSYNIIHQKDSVIYTQQQEINLIHQTILKENSKYK